MRRIPALALTAAALALLLGGCGEEGSSDDTVVTVTEEVTETAAPATDETSTTETTGETTTTGEDGAPPPADMEVTELTTFASPTGNIGCAIEPSSVRCDIGDRDWSPPPKPADCQGDYGQGIQLSAGAQPAFVCAGDSTLGGGEPLPYGQSIAAGLLRCESAATGMTCTDTETGRGFTLAKEAYELF